MSNEENISRQSSENKYTNSEHRTTICEYTVWCDLRKRVRVNMGWFGKVPNHPEISS